MQSVKTTTDGWQQECWKLAKAKQRFAVEGFTERQRPFLEALQSAYGYKLKWHKKKVVCSPLAGEVSPQ